MIASRASWRTLTVYPRADWVGVKRMTVLQIALGRFPSSHFPHDESVKKKPSKVEVNVAEEKMLFDRWVLAIIGVEFKSMAST